MSEKHFWVSTGSHRSVYHVDKKCHSLEEAKDIREAHPREVDKLPVCKHCSGEFKRVYNDKDHYLSAIAADPEDIE